MYVCTYIHSQNYSLAHFLLLFLLFSQNNKRDFIREVAKRRQNEAKKNVKKKRGKRGRRTDFGKKKRLLSW